MSIHPRKTRFVATPCRAEFADALPIIISRERFMRQLRVDAVKRIVQPCCGSIQHRLHRRNLTVNNKVAGKNESGP